MKIRKNIAALARVVAADMSGHTSADLKPLWMAANTFDFDLDTPIFRIIELDRLKADVIANQFSLKNAHPDSWNDKYENPFLKLTAMLDGEEVYIEPLLNDFYASCWTKNPDENMQNWKSFSYKNRSVRIQTTLRKILDRLMCTDCEAYSLRYFAGAVDYVEQTELEQHRLNVAGDANLIMDSQGQALALSVMLVRTFYSTEQEVRVLYSHRPNKWTDNHVSIRGKHCYHTFDWNSCVDEVICGPYMDTKDVSDFKEFLGVAGHNWPVRRTEFSLDEM
ncbi:hypothetical protein [Collimonas humicola]|uniref:hypothetical protein n=1 Tax=Collimonas humicola TaxID=2825886 RepID=UPI001B8B4F3F|nr:hypothetical protein [Collimonas humicola]